MIFRSWQKLVRRVFNRARRPQAAAKKYRPFLEHLEERTVPALFMVTSTADTGSVGTLRWAILQSNQTPSTTPNVIDFDIEAAGGASANGMAQIELTFPLPTIANNPVIIDGTTQPGWDQNQQISIDGSTLAGNTVAANGLTVNVNGCTIEGIAVYNFSKSGIVLYSSGNTVIGDKMVGNNVGITVGNASANNTIGGTLPFAGNAIEYNFQDDVVLEQNCSSVTIWNNSISHSTAGILVRGADNLTIGGSAAGEGNQIDYNVTGIDFVGSDSNHVVGNSIANNYQTGVTIDAQSLGNYVGVDGPTANVNTISNNLTGVAIYGLDNYVVNSSIAGNVEYGIDVFGNVNQIGDGTANGANTINGNLAAGIRIEQAVVFCTVNDNKINNNTADGIDVLGSNAMISHSSLASNGTGIQIEPNAGNNIVQTSTLDGNGTGIYIAGNDNFVWQSNVIENSLGAGVLISGSSNDITGNQFKGNSAGGVYVEAGSGNSIRENTLNQISAISLASGANNNQPAPAITYATFANVSPPQMYVSGTLTAAASKTYILDFYVAQSVWVGSFSVTTNLNGTVSFGQYFTTTNNSYLIGKTPTIVATATDPGGNTSALSNGIVDPPGKAPTTITWATPSAITYGTPLNAHQLDAKANVPGTFKYSPGFGSILKAGSDTLTVTFTPADKALWAVSTATVTLQVNQATPTIAWATPSAITYGTALGAAQLDAASKIAGTFTYSEPAGTILAAGSHTLTVTFTPANATDYTTATQTVTLQVNEARPAITWAAPAAITFGTTLGGAQLDASSKVAGTFTYSQAVGTVLGAGAHTLTVIFTPTDTLDYTSTAKTVTLFVRKAVPAITWTPPAVIAFGTPLSAAQLDAASNTAGTFSYSLPMGILLKPGTHKLTATFTPSDTADYTTAARTVTLTVGNDTQS